MTFSTMKSDVWEALGKPSDLNPDSSDTIGKWINRGMARILTWKFPNGRQIRFKCTEGELFFKTALKTGTAEASGTSTITLESGAVDAVSDIYNGWVIEIDGGTGIGQYRLIVDYDGGSRQATVATAWTTAPDTTSTYSLYKRFMKFINAGANGASDNITIDTNDSIYDVLKVTDLEDETDLGKGDRTANWPGNLTTPATPGAYITFGDRIIFDSPVDEERWYRLEYFKFPAALSGATDEPLMPSNWHEAIVLWATWKGLCRQQEPPMAYATLKNLEDFMIHSIEQESVSDEREDSYMVAELGN